MYRRKADALMQETESSEGETTESSSDEEEDLSTGLCLHEFQKNMQKMGLRVEQKEIDRFGKTTLSQNLKANLKKLHQQGTLNNPNLITQNMIGDNNLKSFDPDSNINNRFGNQSIQNKFYSNPGNQVRSINKKEQLFDTVGLDTKEIDELKEMAKDKKSKRKMHYLKKLENEVAKKVKRAKSRPELKMKPDKIQIFVDRMEAQRLDAEERLKKKRMRLKYEEKKKYTFTPKLNINRGRKKGRKNIREEKRDLAMKLMENDSLENFEKATRGSRSVRASRSVSRSVNRCRNISNSSNQSKSRDHNNFQGSISEKSQKSNPDHWRSSGKKKIPQFYTNQEINNHNNWRSRDTKNYFECTSNNKEIQFRANNVFYDEGNNYKHWENFESANQKIDNQFIHNKKYSQNQTFSDIKSQEFLTKNRDLGRMERSRSRNQKREKIGDKSLRLVRERQKRQEMEKERKKRREEENMNKECTFQPRINDNKKTAKIKQPKNTLDRLYEWKKQSQAKIKRKIEEKEEEFQKEYTFKPILKKNAYNEKKYTNRKLEKVEERLYNNHVLRMKKNDFGDQINDSKTIKTGVIKKNNISIKQNEKVTSIKKRDDKLENRKRPKNKRKKKSHEELRLETDSEEERTRKKINGIRDSEHFEEMKNDVKEIRESKENSNQKQKGKGRDFAKQIQWKESKVSSDFLKYFENEFIGSKKKYQDQNKFDFGGNERKRKSRLKSYRSDFGKGEAIKNLSDQVSKQGNFKIFLIIIIQIL